MAEEGLDLKSAQVHVTAATHNITADDPMFVYAEKRLGAEMVERMLQAAEAVGGLMLTATKANNRAAIEWLIAQGCDPLEPNSTGYMPIHIAAGMGDTALVQCYLQSIAGLHVDTEAAGGNLAGGTCLHAAAGGGQRATID